VEFVDVDGSEGEGGGQILRTAVAFSAIKHRPVRVSKIRAGREVPGLKRQHVAALEVLSKVFEGELSGAKEGSTNVTFVPGRPSLRTLMVDMGTAASITLVLQAVVPAVSFSGSRLELDLVGGTDVPWSPTMDYFQQVVRASYRSVGIMFEAVPSRRGYYPRGGGRVAAAIEPCGSILPVDLSTSQAVTGAVLLSRCGGLPRHVAERQLASASRILEGEGISVLRAEASAEQSDSPGSSILVYHMEDGTYLGSDALGARGKPAEDVGREAAEKFVAEAKSGSRIDSNLADMLLPLLSLAPGQSRVRIREVTSHLRSGMRLAEQFTSCGWSVAEEGGSSIVSISPGGA
jgi:RNA 3'-phosphate cyclase